MKQKGWASVDIIIVSGDAYIDHPSFGPAVIGRYLEYYGYKVGIIAQPDWKNTSAFKVMGKPALFFGVTAGNLDSMISNYTSEKRKRKTDAYSENGETGMRPDRAAIVYSNCIKQCYPESLIVLGGLEASLRRMVHYDYWSEKLRRSILFDSRADILVYGMGESAVLKIAQNIAGKLPLTKISNTACITKKLPDRDYILLPGYEELQKDKKLYAETALTYMREISKKYPLPVVQPCNNRYLVLEVPGRIDTQILDSIYNLPFTRKAHPGYKREVPAFGFVKQSVVSHRGCYGGCSFCSLGAHQGKFIVSRTRQSLLAEIKNSICSQPDFKGSILDVGGPSANMYGSICSNKKECDRISCLYPEICQFLRYKQTAHLSLLDSISKVPGIKNVFVNSGVRFDLALKDSSYIDAVCRSHTGGQLSIAPEHISESVLRLMQKPVFKTYELFVRAFIKANKKYNKKQYIIPYFISAHPGTTLLDMYHLAVYLKKKCLQVQQVQNYIPVPLTLSEAMYYSEYNIFNMKKIHVPKGEERLMHRALLQPHIKANHRLLKKALKKINKENMFLFLVR
ncbi:MAG: YgiQ family radical SAM protein [bacterium]|nr:YgiQ family radical SAM protein [bacterium]